MYGWIKLRCALTVKYTSELYILGMSKLKWTGMYEFNSEDHYIYYYGQESLRRNRVALELTKESKMQYLDAISKTTE